MLEHPEYYLAQLDITPSARPPEFRSLGWLSTVLKSALLEIARLERELGEAREREDKLNNLISAVEDSLWLALAPLLARPAAALAPAPAEEETP